MMVSGRYVFNQASIDAALVSWRQLETDLKTDAREAQRLVDTKPPGNEPASQRMTRKVQDSGKSFLEHNASMQDFVRRFIENLENARNQYVSQEQSTADTYKEGSR